MIGDQKAPDATAKRLVPTKRIIRHLFAYSGNECAFPGCQHRLINDMGDFVAEVCHIEAAEAGGERFNDEMTNEDRRQPENLLLMCHAHHVETDDVSVWTVEKMRGLKAAHERQFEDAVERITQSAITDITKAAVSHDSHTLRRYGKVMEWQNSDDELLETNEELVLPLLKKMGKLAPDTRGVLLIIVERGESYRGDLGLPTHELEQATGLQADDLWPHIDTMGRYGIAYLDEDEDGRQWVTTKELDGWPFWHSLREYCQKTHLEVGAFVTDLHFDLLD